MRILHVLLFSAVGLAALRAQDNDPRTFSFDRNPVLGTSLRLLVAAPDEATAGAAERAVLAEIERLELVLSGYATDSEIRRFAAQAGPQPVSADLHAVLAACDHWHAASEGAFHAGVEVLTRIWREAEQAGTPPTDERLAAAVAALAAPAWRLDTVGEGDAGPTAERLGDLPFSADALAKGYVLDHACARALHDVPTATGILLEIGGDLRAMGQGPWIVGVQDPRTPADNAHPACRLTLAGGAIATSAGYARGFQFGAKHLSHVIDPRSGRPVDGVLSATVVAADATTADALATILNVLAPIDGLTLVAKTPGVECLIVAADGSEYVSLGFDALRVASAPAPAAANGWPDGFEFAVDFVIGNPDAEAARAARGGRRGGGGYRRPYVAVWIEDSDGHPVRTLCLWIQRTRWLPDLRRWSKLHRGEDAFVESISRATRKQGEYHLTWDGADDEGDAVAPGEYVLHIEAAREHGSYQLMKQAVTIGAAPFEHELEGNSEIASAKVHFGKSGGAH